MTMKASSIVLIDNLPSGVPGPDNFRIENTEVSEAVGTGEVLIKILVISADPYLRGRIKEGEGNVRPGEVMVGFVGGKVLKSDNRKWVEGDLFGAHLPFTTIQLLTGAQLAETLMWKLTDKISEDQISYSIGVLGMPGATAYGGLVDVLRPNNGETIFISAASGAVGGLVGQISKQIYDCKVIGSCGGEEKCRLVQETFDYDAAIDYKKIANAAELVVKLKKIAPGGIDMYFENVGGMHFEAAMEVLRPKGRIAVCGQISEYNSVTPQLCSFNPMKMIYTNQRIEGFVSMRWLSGQEGNFLEDMNKWLLEGKLKPQETFFDGIELWPAAFESLFTGNHVGKVVVRV